MPSQNLDFSAEMMVWIREAGWATLMANDGN
jgi:hypothetical protein